MGLNSRERFENHMDIASPEMVGDAEKIEYIEEDVEDDMFEKRLLQAEKYIENMSTILLKKNEKECGDKKENYSKDRFKRSSTGLCLENSELENKKEAKGDIVFEGKALENLQYGDGGGNQYFIRDFGKMKQDGRMVKISERYLNYSRENDVKRKEIFEVDKQKNKFTYKVDTKELTAVEKEEWKQLDEQTREEQGLSRVMPDIEAQKMEDYKNPWNDQENSNGFFMPDSYKNPREIRKNEIYYQLRSIEAVYDSPYLTDEKTIESCQEKNGMIDVRKLLQKLQIKPSNSEIYILTQYIYRKGEKSNQER